MIYVISFIGIILTILFVVGTHEYAHFITARLVGVKVLRFSIGFGKVIWSYTDKKGTEYALAPIPLGGYVKMLDENEGAVPDSEKHLAYNRQPYYKKFLIVLAGPLCNLFCALLIYWGLFLYGVTTIKPIIGKVESKSIAATAGLKTGMQITHVDNRRTQTWGRILFQLLYHAGNQDTLNIQTVNTKNDKIGIYQLDLTTWEMDNLKPNPLKSLGISIFEPRIPTYIGGFTDGSPAKTAGFETGDRLIKINNKPVNNWYQIAKFIYENPGEKATFTVLRNKKYVKIPMTINSDKHWFGDDTGFIGITPDFKWPDKYIQTIKYSPLVALQEAYYETYEFTVLNLVLLGKMITGKLSFQGLGGPITIFQTAGTALNSGLFSFLNFLAFLSIAIGVINFLPIPGLDGGHMLIQTIEAITRRPLPEIVIEWLYKFGLILIVLVFFQALLNDLLRLY